MSREFTREAVTKFLPAQFLWIWCKFIPFKDFQSDQIQRSCCKIFTAHYACRNSNLNLTRTTNGVIFQIINLLIESWGLRLTCLDCNLETPFRLHRCICDIALLVWKRRSFCKERRFEAYYASNIGWKRTNNKFRCWKILIPGKILCVYYSGTSI